jgi:FkbM family methyltransferase
VSKGHNPDKLRVETELHRTVVQREDGLWWPAQVGGRRHKLPSQVTDANHAIKLCSGRRLAVQAGGHVGLWPLYLATHFDRVFTFEADPVNWECLRKNTDQTGGLVRVHGALGERYDRRVPWRRSLGNTGKHKVATTGKSSDWVVMFSLDMFSPTTCDLICLDVEGYELPALKGAEKTIERCRPVIMVEDAGHAKMHRYKSDDMWAWLTAHGYREVAKVGEYDRVWAPSEEIEHGH